MNIRDIGPAIVGFSEKIKASVPRLFSRESDVMIQATYNETSELSKWVQREKFMSFSGMLVPVPPGLNVYFSDHLAHLEKVWSSLAFIQDGVLKPTDQVLARFANEPGNLTVPGTFKFAKHAYPLSNINPADLVNMLAKDFNGGAIDQRPFEKTYRSATDLESTFVRARALLDNMSSSKRKDVNRIVESIYASCEVIANSPVNPVVANELSLLIESTNAWVELLGLFMKQTQELVGCMNLTTDQIKLLAERDKK